MQTSLDGWVGFYDEVVLEDADAEGSSLCIGCFAELGVLVWDVICGYLAAHVPEQCHLEDCPGSLPLATTSA